MSTVLVVTADLQGDPRDLIKAFDTAQKAAEEYARKNEEQSRRSSSAWDSFKGGLAGIATGIAAAFTIDKVVAFTNEVITQAGNLQQSAGAVDAVFKGQADQVHAWAQGAADSVGLSTDAYNNFAAVIGTQMKTAGFSLEDAATKTNGLIGVSADLASMFGGTTSDAVDALSAAFRGEYDSIEKYGMSIKESDIQARLAAKGMKDLEGEAYRNARAQELLAIINEQSADSLGNFGKEADTLQGQQQRLRAEFENQQAALGNDLLPIMTALAEVARAVLPGAFAVLQGAVTGTIEVVSAVVGWFEENATLVSFLASVLGGAAAAYGIYFAVVNAGAAAMAVVSAATKVWTGIQWLLNAAMSANPIGLIIVAIGALVGAIIWVATQTTFFQDAWANVSSFFVSLWTTVSQFFIDTWNNIVAFIGPIVDSVVGFITGAATTAAQIWNDTWTAVSSFFTGIWNSIVAFLTPVFEFIATLIRVYIETYVNIFLIFAAVLKTIWDGIVAVVTTVWQAIVDFLTPIITWIVDLIVSNFTATLAFWTGVWEAVSSFFVGIWNGLVDFLTPIVLWLVETVTNAVTTVQGIWNSVWEAISSFFTGIWNAIVGFLVPIVTTVVSTVTNGVNTAQSVWNSVWSSISSFLSDVWNNISNAVRAGVDAVVTTVSGLWDQVMSFFSGAGQWLYDIGTDIIQGLINGITSMIGNVISAIGDTVNGAIDWAKSTLGIASPSKVFLEIGKFTGEGMEIGIERSARGIQRASEALVPVVPDPKSLTAAWNVASNTGTYGVPPWASAGQQQSTAAAPITLDIKVERSEIDDMDIDGLVEVLLQKIMYALGGAVTT